MTPFTLNHVVVQQLVFKSILTLFVLSKKNIDIVEILYNWGTACRENRSLKHNKIMYKC